MPLSSVAVHDKSSTTHRLRRCGSALYKLHFPQCPGSVVVQCKNSTASWAGLLVPPARGPAHYKSSTTHRP